MPPSLHALAGGLALTLILGFWTATIGTELFGTAAAVVAVKTTIPWLFLLLAPALALSALSGRALARRRPGELSRRKARRMPVVALNGLLILVPAALFLAAKARAGELDGVFMAVQGVELLAGAVNIALLSANLRDGLALARRTA